MQIGHQRRAFLGGRDRDDFGLGMPKQDAQKLERRVAGPAEYGDLGHTRFVSELQGAVRRTDRQAKVHLCDSDLIDADVKRTLHRFAGWPIIGNTQVKEQGG